jgi:hypothetical protein
VFNTLCHSKTILFYTYKQVQWMGQGSWLEAQIELCSAGNNGEEPLLCIIIIDMSGCYCPCIGPLRPASSTLLGPRPTAQEMLDTDLCTGMSIGLYERGRTPFGLLCEQKLACFPALLWCAARITRRDWR